MRWCEQNDVDYVFGLARNERLRKRIGKAMRKASVESKRTGLTRSTANQISLEGRPSSRCP